MEKKPKNLKKIHELGDRYETKSFVIISQIINRLLDGFFHFKKRKGEIVAGSATLFSILSFCPIILLTVSLTGFVLGDIEVAKTFVLTTIENNFPELAPWILKSISEIVEGQLKANGLNVINTAVLLYACLGVVSTIIFGINTIAKTESKGGFFFEDLKSLATGLCVAFFILSVFVLSHKQLILATFTSQNEVGNQVLGFLVNYNILPIVASLSFFTLFYKHATHVQVEFKDSIKGALTFVGCFVLGKSFYWVFLLYSKGSLAQTYGNFYTIFIAVFWVYFLMCSFFYGASVAYVNYQDIYRGQEAIEKPELASENVHSEEIEILKKSA